MIFKIVIIRIFFWPYVAAEYFSANSLAGNTMVFFLIPETKFCADFTD